MRRIYFVLSLLAASVLIANAQVNPVYRRMEINRHNKTIHWADSLHGRDSLVAQRFSFFGYDDSTVVRLRRLGVNFPFNFDGSVWNAKEKAAVADCIAMGRVTNIERTREHRQFLTIAHIQVDEFLRNDYHLSKNEVPVMIQTGLGGGATYSSSGDEDTVAVGEHVLLFLSAASLISYAENNDTTYLKVLANDPAIRLRILGYEGKYTIRGDKAYCRSGGESVMVIKRQVAEVMAALCKPMPK